MSPLSLFLVFLFISPSFSAFLAPITKHHLHSKPFYILKLHLKTPLQPTALLLHVSATITAVDCIRNYTSTTFRPVPCNSSLCHSLQSNQPNTTTTCGITSGKKTVAPGACVIPPRHAFALVDSLGLPTTNGRNPGQLAVFPEFVFTCSDDSARELQGHAKKEVSGIAGFGFSKFSLPAQVTTTATATATAASTVFALCLSGSPSAPGVAFFDRVKPYYFLPGIDISENLNYTPISSHPNTKSNEDPYFIEVKSININGKPITINKKLVTKISTTNPYTVLERSIYTAFIKAFTNESSLKPITKPVKPFKICYEAKDLSETHLGPNVPAIELVMVNDVIWSVFGKNSMARFVDEGMDVWCLAVVDGGVRSSYSMVIGGHQLEDNLLEFDLGEKKLGFSSSLLHHRTMCANFNFTTIKLL